MGFDLRDFLRTGLQGLDIYHAGKTNQLVERQRLTNQAQKTRMDNMINSARVQKEQAMTEYYSAQAEAEAAEMERDQKAVRYIQLKGARNITLVDQAGVAPPIYMRDEDDNLMPNLDSQKQTGQTTQKDISTETKKVSKARISTYDDAMDVWNKADKNQKSEPVIRAEVNKDFEKIGIEQSSPEFEKEVQRQLEAQKPGPKPKPPPMSPALQDTVQMAQDDPSLYNQLYAGYDPLAQPPMGGAGWPFPDGSDLGATPGVPVQGGQIGQIGQEVAGGLGFPDEWATSFEDYPSYDEFWKSAQNENLSEEYLNAAKLWYGEH